MLFPVLVGFVIGSGIVYLFCGIFLRPTDSVFFTFDYFKQALLFPVVMGGGFGCLGGILWRRMVGRTHQPSSPLVDTLSEDKIWPPAPNGPLPPPNL